MPIPGCRFAARDANSGGVPAPGARIFPLPDPAIRLLVVFAGLIGTAVVVLKFVVPPGLMDTAAHVRSTIQRESSKNPRYGGAVLCAECHDESDTKKKGYHRNLSCETCHGSAKAHAEDPTAIKPTPPRKREFCVLCHAFDPSRPTGFPQINPAVHNPLKPCITCHNPHDPKPPEVPRECQACHGEIARTKAVSPHVLLECTTCHEVPDGHKVTPRAVAASMPTDRSFCGKCHDKDSKEKEPPKVDVATHGEKYLCWQCHYPHMPEIE
jgi:cytochrome c7-like protein